MTRLKSLTGVTCLALLLSPFVTMPAIAGAPTAAMSEMDTRMAAASDLLDAMGGRQSVTTQISRVIPAQMQALQTQFPNMSAEMRNAIESSMRVEMSKGVNQLLMQMAGAWAHRFTVKELRELTAFHRSPTGKKLRAQQEDLQREISEIGRNWGADIGKRIQQHLNDHMTKAPALTS
ncbi:MAG: DUF2059 domain-containing protein [Micropepsaceae bacterium]